MKIGGKKIGGYVGGKLDSVSNKYSGINWKDPATVAAAALSFYAGGQIAQGLGVTPSMGGGPNPTLGAGTPVATPLSVPGVALGAGLTALIAARGGDPTPDVESAPTIDETNDPNLAAQFKRMRAAARALGRAGTIKNKGAGTLGDSAPLGSNMTLQGS